MKIKTDVIHSCTHFIHRHGAMETARRGRSREWRVSVRSEVSGPTMLWPCTILPCYLPILINILSIPALQTVQTRTRGAWARVICRAESAVRNQGHALLQDRV